MPLPQEIARFNRRVTNRVTGIFAGWLPGFAMVIHTGRRSGKTYRTPVNVFRDGDDYLIALTYGSDTDWIHNIKAAGACQIVTRGQRIRLTRPRIITDPVLRWVPLPVRLVLRRIGVSQYLRMTRVGGE